MKLITTYESGSNYSNKVTMFKHKYLHLFTSWLYSSSISIEAFNSWIQKGSITKTEKPI